MRHVPLAIGKLLAEIADLRMAGEYERCYRRSKELLASIEGAALDAGASCRILIAAAGSAYYVNRFDECAGLLDRCDRELAAVAEPLRHELAVRANLVRANILRRLGRYTEALELLNGSGWDESIETKVEGLLIAGACHYYLKNLESADGALETALGLATHLDDDRLRSRVLSMMGLAAQGKGLLGSAEEYLTRSMELCHALSDAYGEASAGLNLGIVLYRRGRFEDAASVIERARSTFKAIGWDIGECRSILARGNVEKYRRNIAGGEKYYIEAMKIAEERDFVREQALAHEFLGELDAMRGLFDTALDRYRMSLELALDAGPALDIKVEAHRRIGELHLSRGEHEEALGWLDEGLELSRRIRERLEEGAILRAMGLAHAGAGREAEANEHIEQSLDVLRSIGARFEIAVTYLRAVESMLAPGNGGAGKEPGCEPVARTDRADEAWSMLVEATHLFAEAGAEYWRKRAVDLLMTLDTPRRHRVGGNEICVVGDSLVRLRHNDEFLAHDGFVCVSDAMRGVSDRAVFSAECSRPVLIMGETGTGKEVVARLVHDRSDRSGKPFVAVNCAAIPDHLFESEFFGHRKGCFTGALTDRTGIFEEASGGTLFLDEIGELTTLQQVKLLRVLQEGTIRRIGENRERPVDIRIISATNQDIEEKLESASFREDFYYRINAEQIHIPPLRERREDIVPLVTYYLCGRNGSGRTFVLIEEAALQCLQGYRWPGNVRELFHLLERLKDLSRDGPIRLAMLPERMRNGSRSSRGVSSVEAEGSGGSTSERLERVLSLCGGNKSAAARLLGISRGTLYKELRRSGLSNRIRPPSTP